MKFKLFYGKSKYALLIAVIVLALAAVIVNSIFLTGVGTLTTAVPAAAGVSLACSALIIIFVLSILFNSHYKLTETTLNTTVSFITDKIPYEFITDIKENIETKELFVLYRTAKMQNEDDRASVKMLIKPDEYQNFIKALRAKNPAVLYDTFTIDKEDKKDKDGEGKNKK